MLTKSLLTKIQDTYLGKDSEAINQEDKNLIREELRRIIAEELDIQTEDIDDNSLFLDLGLDSISTLEIFDEIKKGLKVSIPTGQIMSFARNKKAETKELSINSMCDLIVELVQTQGKIQ